MARSFFFTPPDVAGVHLSQLPGSDKKLATGDEDDASLGARVQM